MRIGLFTDTYLPVINGISYVIDITRKEFEKAGHEVFIFAPSPSLRGYTETDDHVIRFRAVKDIFFKGQLTSIFFPPVALRKIKQRKLDVVHFFTPAQIGLLGVYVAMEQNLPLFTTYCTDMHEYVGHYPQVFPGLLALNFVAPFMIKADAKELGQTLAAMRPQESVVEWNQAFVEKMLTVLHNRCSSIVAPSEKIKAQLVSWGTRAPIEVIPTGIDVLPFNAKAVTRFKTKYSISNKDKVVLYLGRLGPEKNLEMLLEAFRMVLKSQPNAKLILAGDHEYRSQLVKLAKKLDILDRVVFTGFIPRKNVGNIYALANIFAFPSITDTQGMVLHEAANAGLPIVMLDPKVTEVVKNNVNGLVVNNSEKAFSAALIKLLSNSNLAVQMGQKSKQIVKKYSAKSQAQKVIELYEKSIITLED